MSCPLSAILELPEVRARVCRVSVEAYEALGEKGLVKKTELLRGLIADKPLKSPLHCTLAQRIFVTLLTMERAGYVAFLYAPLRLLDSMPEPDGMIVRGGEKDFDTRHPEIAELVVEIADGSAVLDRANCSLYAEANVPEYWIVLAREKQIEVYRQPEGGAYRQKRLYSASETLACASVPGLQVVVTDWFA